MSVNVCIIFIHIMHIHAGTHDVIDASIVKSNKIEVTVVYYENAVAKGALVMFVFIDDNNAINFTRSTVLALDKNVPPKYILPFNLFPGQYIVLIYDIGHNGTLSGSIGYPAVISGVRSEVGQGKQCYFKTFLL